MRPRAAEDWERRRRTLTHDVLKNRLNTALSKLCVVLDGRVRDATFVAEFYTALPRDVRAVIAEVRWLREHAIDALSPRAYFDEWPLCECDHDTRVWLPDVLEALWLERTCLRVKLDQVDAAATAFAREALALARKLAEGAGPALVDDARGLQQLGTALASALSRIGAAHSLHLVAA